MQPALCLFDIAGAAGVALGLTNAAGGLTSAAGGVRYNIAGAAGVTG